MLSFPQNPSVGDKFPDPAVPDVLQWQWSGSRWERVQAPSGTPVASGSMTILVGSTHTLNATMAIGSANTTVEVVASGAGLTNGPSEAVRNTPGLTAMVLTGIG